MQIDVGGSRVHDLQSLGQRVWLDGIYRGMLNPTHRRLFGGSQFSHLISSDGICGVGFKLADRAAAYSEDSVYREAVAKLLTAGATAGPICERLGIEDIGRTADQLRRVYEQTDGHDGYASVALSPDFVHDADGTETEARRLWNLIDAPNLMIKVPATDAGLLAIRRLIGAGLNVDASSIFGARRYQQVIDAFLSGLEDRLAAGRPIDRIASVASIFISRIDSMVDSELDAIQPPAKAVRAMRLRGRAAIAVARFAYQKYKSVTASPRWQYLAANHAQPQRLRWACTHTDDARAGDVEYVNALVGRDTITTMSLNTLDAYRDHGSVAPTLERNLLDVCDVFAELAELGVDLDRVSVDLERDGINARATGINIALARLGLREPHQFVS